MASTRSSQASGQVTDQESSKYCTCAAIRIPHAAERSNAPAAPASETSTLQRRDAAAVSCSGWILMKALACADGGSTQPPPSHHPQPEAFPMPYFQPQPETPFYALRRRRSPRQVPLPQPPRPRRPGTLRPYPARRPGVLPQSRPVLPRRPRRRLLVQALLVRARRHLSPPTVPTTWARLATRLQSRDMRRSFLARPAGRPAPRGVQGPRSNRRNQRIRLEQV
jgi:hypothetical protein